MFLTVKARVKNFLECFLVVQKCPQNAQVTWISGKQIDADATQDANGRLLIRIITDFLESIKYILRTSCKCKWFDFLGTLKQYVNL